MSPAFGGRHSSIIDNSKTPFSSVSEDTTNHIDQRNRNTPKHKASHHRFLTWVAYSRKRAPNMDDIQRRTCPLIGCEKEFGDQETMLEHVFSCLCLWNGLYRCAICGQAERISKCYTDGDCRGPHLGKDTLSTVVNSLRLARQFFSHTSKGRRVAERRPTKREIVPKEHIELDGHPAESETGVSELAVDTDTSLNELDTGIDLRNGLHGFVKELQGSVLPTELRGDDEYIWSGHCHLQTGPAELSTSYNYTEYAEEHENSPYTPTGIYVPEPSPTTEHTSHHQRFHPWPSSLAYGKETLRGLRVQIPDLEYSPMPNSADDLHQLYDHAPALSGPARYYEHINFSDILARMNVPNNEGYSPAILPVSPVESSSSSGDTTGFSSDSMDSILSPLTPSTPDFEQNTQAERYNQHPYGIIRDQRSEFETFQSLPESGISSYATFELGDYHVGRGVAYSEHAPSHLMQSPTQHKYQRSEVPFSPSSPSLESSPEASMTDSSLSALPHYCDLDYKCSDCGYEPSGKEINKKSNLKRHQKKSCRRFSPYSGNEKPHRCTYRDCGRRYTRSDNLLVHRRNKGHFEVFDLGADMLLPKADPKTMPEMLGEAHNVAGWDIVGDNQWSGVMFRSY